MPLFFVIVLHFVASFVLSFLSVGFFVVFVSIAAAIFCSFCSCADKFFKFWLFCSCCFDIVDVFLLLSMLLLFIYL